MFLKQYLSQSAASASCNPSSVPFHDRCSYVLNHSDTCFAADGLIPWHYLEYCVFGERELYILLAAALCTVFLLTLLAKAASDFFCPALEVISEGLKLSPAIAGATLLALGNGAPDVFIQLAATATGGAVDREGIVIALTEPVGGGLFVTNVVLGAVLLFGAKMNTVRVEGRVFLKDACFFLGSLVIVFWVVMSKQGYQVYGVLLLLGYVAYVIVTLICGERDEVVDTHDKHHTHVVHYLPPLVPQYIPDSPSSESSGTCFSGGEAGPLAPLLEHMHHMHDAEHNNAHSADAHQHDKLNGPSANFNSLFEIHHNSETVSKVHVTKVSTEARRSERLRTTYNSTKIVTSSSPISDADQHANLTEPLLQLLSPRPVSPDVGLPCLDQSALPPPHSVPSIVTDHAISGTTVMPIDMSSFLAASIPLPTTAESTANHHTSAVASLSATKLEQVGTVHEDHRFAIQQYTRVQTVGNGHSSEDFARHTAVTVGQRDHEVHVIGNGSSLESRQHSGHLCNGNDCSVHHHHHHHHHHHRKQSRTLAYLACLWEFLCLPLDLLLSCTMPFVATGGDPPYARWQASFLPFTLPLFLAFTLNPDVFQSQNLWLWGTYGVVATAGAILVFKCWPVANGPQGAFNMILAVLSFLLAALWMEQGANELVAVCSYLGTKVGISPSVLGATVLAWGNALPDLVCNVTMAREGFPSMALAAVFASPLFVLSVGAGIGLSSGVWSDPANMEAVTCPVRMVYLSAIVTTILHIILGAAVFKYNLGRTHAIIAVAMYAVYQAIYVAIIVPNSALHNWCS